jgi:hypothetical protein
MHGPAARAHGLARAHAPERSPRMPRTLSAERRQCPRRGRGASGQGGQYRVGHRIQGSRPTRCTPRHLPRGTHPHTRGSQRESILSLATYQRSRGDCEGCHIAAPLLPPSLACGARAAARNAAVRTTTGRPAARRGTCLKDTQPNITYVKVLYYILGSSIGGSGSGSSSSDGGRGSDSNGSNGSRSSAEIEKMDFFKNGKMGRARPSPYPGASRKARVTGPVASRAVPSGQTAVSAGTETLRIYDRGSADLSHSETMIIQ